MLASGVDQATVHEDWRLARFEDISNLCQDLQELK
jgi:hypothetical protein